MHSEQTDRQTDKHSKIYIEKMMTHRCCATITGQSDQRVATVRGQTICSIAMYTDERFLLARIFPRMEERLTFDS